MQMFMLGIVLLCMSTMAFADEQITMSYSAAWFTSRLHGEYVRTQGCGSFRVMEQNGAKFGTITCKKGAVLKIDVEIQSGRIYAIEGGSFAPFPFIYNSSNDSTTIVLGRDLVIVALEVEVLNEPSRP